MDTCIWRRIRADPELVFELAAAVADWPRILPHYRWVRVLARREQAVLVEMAARRQVLGGLSIPLWWRAIAAPDPASRRIRFEHVAGATRGMQVEWRLVPFDDGRGGVEVSIRHIFRPRWPAPDWLIRAVVGDYFVNGVARRTLRCMAEHAERRAAHARKRA